MDRSWMNESRMSPEYEEDMEEFLHGAGGGTIPLIYDRPAQTFREAEGGLSKPEYLIVR